MQMNDEESFGETFVFLNDHSGKNVLLLHLSLEAVIQKYYGCNKL